MKNIEKLKEEQQELKERLKRLIDFMNSEEFFTVPDGEKSLLNSQRAGMEMYLNALTNRIYSDVNSSGFAGINYLFIWQQEKLFPAQTGSRRLPGTRQQREPR